MASLNRNDRESVLLSHALPNDAMGRRFHKESVRFSINKKGVAPDGTTP